MEKQMFFVIYLEEFYGDGSSKSDTWKIGSALSEDYKETMKVYMQASQSHSCKICKTI